MTSTATVTLTDFLAEHAICRVWHTGFDAPTGDEHILSDDDGEDYCGSEELLGVLTDWLGLDLDAVEGSVSQDADGELRWEWAGGEDLRNCRGNSIYRLVVWGLT